MVTLRQSTASVEGRPAEGGPGTPSPSGWAARTARTRQALIDASLELFAERGYDSTTTDEIVERAGVSPRTFFRYFPTKETVVFFGREDFFHSFADLYLAQPRAMSDVEAMVASFVALVPTVERIRRRVGLYSRALASSAVLRGREAELKDEQVHKIAETIARRAGGPGATARSELLASIGDLVMGRSLDRWLREPDDRANLTELIVDEFAAVLELFGSRPSSRRRRTR